MSKNDFRYHPVDRRRPRMSPEEEREEYYDRIHVKVGENHLHKLSWVNIAVLLFVFAAFFLGSLLMEKPKVSQIEKRDLAQFPEVNAENLFSGKLSRGIETWYADTFPFRDGFVALSAVIDEAHGVRVDDVRIVAPSGGEAQDIPPDVEQVTSTPSAAQEPESSSSSENSSSPSAVQPPITDDGATPGEINNGTFVYKGMAMSLFGTSTDLGQWYADVINEYHKELPGVQIYDMIIPTAIDFYVPEKYKDLTKSQKEMADYIYNALDPSIKTIDAHSKIVQHTNEYIYLRTDHHWTALGAYYAYTAFCEKAGFTPVPLDKFETHRIENFVGSMYGITQDSSLLKNPDYVDYYIPDVEYTAKRYNRDQPFVGVDATIWAGYASGQNSYSVFLYGDWPLYEIKTNVRNGRKILVVKESFGNAFAPFLISHYEEVYVVDQRYFQLPLINFIKEHGIGELMFANNTFAACTPYHIKCIDGMRHQVWPPYKPPVAVPAATPEPVVEATPEPVVEPVPEETAVSEEDTGGKLLRKPHKKADADG